MNNVSTTYHNDLFYVLTTLAFIDIETEFDIIEGRRQTGLHAKALGFSTVDVHFLVTCASELCYNLIIHAHSGVFVLNLLQNRQTGQQGFELMTKDRGPGISDIDLAMTDGYSTSKGLGSGLPGVSHCCDVLSITPRLGGGTCVRAIKWLT